jgi:hypothetical protein
VSSWGRIWSRVAVLLALAACHGLSGVHHAEVLSTRFPAKVLAIEPTNRKCVADDECPFRYRLRITNPTDRDANVQRCTVNEPVHLFIPVMGIAGLSVPAGTTQVVRASFYLAIPKERVGGSRGAEATCEVDGHGEPPI